MRKKCHNKFAILFLLVFSMGIVVSCSVEKPSPKVIAQAKLRTMAIIDSLNDVREVVRSEPRLEREFFDERNQRYVLEYRIFVGVDSLDEQDLNAFIKKTDGDWIYDFTVGAEAYREVLKP